MTNKKSTITDEDITAFKNAVTGTKPLSHNKIRLRSADLPVSKKRRKDTTHDPLHLHEQAYTPPVSANENMSYKQDGISNKVLRNLQKGQYNVDATLDLHGMSVDVAREAVNQFLCGCLQNNLRVALIIHGKGKQTEMPILKNKLNLWLRSVREILAFCSAATKHGSRGAVYVLLKDTVRGDLTGG